MHPEGFSGSYSHLPFAPSPFRRGQVNAPYDKMSYYLKDDAPAPSFPLLDGEDGKGEDSPLRKITVKANPQTLESLKSLRILLLREGLDPGKVELCLSAKAVLLELAASGLPQHLFELISSPERCDWKVFFERKGLHFPFYPSLTSVPLTPIEATLYKYFLIHPEGLRLEDLWEKFDELCLIYRSIRDPRGILSVRVDPVDMLCEDSHATFYTLLSRIRRRMSASLKKEDVELYCPHLSAPGHYLVRGAWSVYWA